MIAGRWAPGVSGAQDADQHATVSCCGAAEAGMEQ